jgi:pilus assembly protein TadC
MRRKLPVRFWFEAITGVVGLVLFIVTLFSREWIEELTGWDPDGGNGSLEIGLVFALLALSLTSMLFARREYRSARTRVTLSQSA